MVSNVFIAYLAQKLEAGGSETTIYLDRITTLTGETVSTSDFADFSRGILTANPDGDGVSSYPEYISFTAISGLTLTGATRGLSAKSNSVVSANKRFHPVGTPVILSWGSHNIQDMLDYIDAQIAALTLGANVVSIATCGEDVSAGEFLYLKDDGKWWKTDADTVATIDNVQLGVAQGAGTTDGLITGGVLTKGVDANQTGLVTGTEYFISNTAGAIGTSAGTNSKKVGVARSTTAIYIDFAYGELPSSAEKAAMAGVNNVPSSSNPFVTQDDLSDDTVLPPQVVTFTSSGTWTKDAGLKYIVVEGVGGGGGGEASTSSNGSVGCGGAAGAYFRKLILASDLGATETVTIGAAGARGVGSGVAGTAGGTTSFGSHASATGGEGGDSSNDPMSGGTATGGDINLDGGPSGQSGLGAGLNGIGGDSYFGKGGLLASNSSNTGTGYGSGGSGGYCSSSSTTRPGAVGKAGYVIVTEYYS